jgi:hypothetical protein
VLPDYLELEIRREAMMLSEACAVTETSGRVTPETAPAIAGPIPLGPQRGRARPRDFAPRFRGLAPPKPTDSVEPFVLSITASLRRAGKGVRLVIGGLSTMSAGESGFGFEPERSSRG